MKEFRLVFMLMKSILAQHPDIGADEEIRQDELHLWEAAGKLLRKNNGRPRYTRPEQKIHALAIQEGMKPGQTFEEFRKKGNWDNTAIYDLKYFS